MSNTVRLLLFDKEISGLKMMLILKLVFLSTMTAMFLILDYKRQTIYFSFFIYFFFLPLTLFLLYRLWNKKNTMLISLYSIITDIAVLSYIPILWYSDLSGIINVSVILKFDVAMIVAVFISVNAITLNPKYPLIMTITGVIIHIAMITIVHHSGTANITSDFTVSNTTDAVHYGNFISKIIAISGFGFFITATTFLARRSLKKAVELENANKNLERYFSPSVIQTIESNEDFLNSTITHDIAVMFTDIRNFTAYSESEKAENVTAFLKEYHELMVKVIFAHGGTVDKFLGDGIMVTFGTPSASPDDAENAVNAAIDMQKKLFHLNIRRRSEGKNELHQGIGIHYGPAIIGNIGTKEKLEYTVIGDTVNIASRIESQCKEFGESILISQNVKDRLQKQHDYIEYSNVSLKGKTDSINLFGISTENSKEV